MGRQAIGKWCILAAVTALGPVSSVFAGYQDDIRYTQLKTELGAATPTGVGVRVGQVEAVIPVNVGHYTIDQSKPEFQLPGRQYLVVSGNTGGHSAHAEDVARRFYGTGSMTPGIPIVEEYSAIYNNTVSGWVDSKYLRTIGLQLPVLPPVDQRMKVVNHSWMYTWPGGFGGGVSNYNIDISRRLDYVVRTQDQVHVVGMPNAGQGKQALLAASFNAIAVGLTNGQHETGATDLQKTNYNAGRIRPDLVAPDVGTSYAAPQVSSAAALLVDTAQRAGHTWGTKPQVIKAALMAGADRNASFGSAYARNTSNGLSSHYGAGELDVYNSYQILNAGEPAGPSIGRYGFDYNPAFNSDQTVRYGFRTGGEVVALGASLAWHINVMPNTPFPDQSQFGTDVLHDLDLALFDMTAGGTLVQSSYGTTENTENLWLTSLPAGREYELRVLTKGPAAFTWDYGLAWQFSGEVLPVPEPAGLALVAIAGLVLRRRRSRQGQTIV